MVVGGNPYVLAERLELLAAGFVLLAKPSKKMKKNFVLLIASAFLIPNMVLAAWWNPVSWIRKTSSTTPELSVPIVPDTEVLKNVAEKEIVKPKIFERVVTQTVKIDSPELLNKVNLLTAENNNLKSQIASYVSKLNSCQADLKERITQVSIVPATTKEDPYSDFNFRYGFDGTDITFNNQTYRTFSVQKLVFVLPDNRLLDEKDTINELYMLAGVAKPGVVGYKGGDKYNLERIDNTTFIYSGKPIGISNSTYITAVIRGTLHTYNLKPKMSEWIIVDNTNSKPVKLD